MEEVEIPQEESGFFEGKVVSPAGYLHINFMKLKDARYLGHLDMVRAILMAARRCRLPMAYSHGFHPAPKVRFSSPIPLGMESMCEAAEFALIRPCDPREVKDAMNSFLPEGVRILRARVTSLKTSEGFDTFKLANYMCLFEIFDARKAQSLMEIARQVRLRKIVRVLCLVKGEQVPVSLPATLEIGEVIRYPRWIRMNLRITNLPKGVRPMPLITELFGLRGDGNCRLRMIKQKNRSDGIGKSEASEPL
jgi:radical SAM-linked protein